MKEGIFLFIAIVAEVIGTGSLKLTNGFKLFIPSLVVVVMYFIAMFCLSQAVKTIPVGIVYAIWSALGLVFTALIGYFFYNENLNLIQCIGMVLVIFGVIMMQVFSKSIH